MAFGTVVGLLFLAQGCMTTPRYFADRGNDILDIVTCTGGVGAGGKVRIGPVQLGLLVNRDVVGLRGGAFRWWPDTAQDLLFSEYDFIFISADYFNDENADVREKLYSAVGGAVIKEVCPNAPQRSEGLSYYQTQIEVVVGLLGSLRIGVNPGELADFLLGWFGVDIFHDDIGRLPQNDQNIPADGYSAPGEPIERIGSDLNN
jgi:hypothetical protein